MHLTKHHALGNDFIVALIDVVPKNAPALALQWCHRKQGLGADGLIFATPSVNLDSDLVMTLFNSDGSQAEMSGNGLRCLAQAELYRRGEGRNLIIAAGGGLRSVSVVSDSGVEMELEVSMGTVGPGPDLPELNKLQRPGFEVLRAATGEIGNSHVVLEVNDLNLVEPAIDGPAIESNWQPEGINVHFVTGSGRDEMNIVHWERGVGVTQACGSGATVASVIAYRWGLVGKQVMVRMPGGRSLVQVADPVTLTGPVAHVASIDVPNV